MRKFLSHRVTRPVAGLLAGLFLLLWQAPPAAAFYKPDQSRGRHGRTQTPTPEERQQIDAKEAEASRPTDVRELTAAEMKAFRGRGPYRNSAFNGVLPWQKSFREVNLCNGNLFKSYTDIKVAPARGAGLAFQRNYNSNDERVGPFGVGWTHTYDIRMNETGTNDVPRTDYFGGKHVYERDADGLYSPPPYMFDELSSDYDLFEVNGPAEVLSDDQKGMEGTVKHFTSGGLDADGSPSGERVIDTITDRHGNQTVFTYGLTVTMADGSTKQLLTRVTDPSGRYVDVSWVNLGSSGSPAMRISEVAGPFDGNNNPIYTVSYEYNSDGNLWKVRQDPNGLNRVTTFTYTTSNGEAGLLASVSDPLGHTVSYTYDFLDTAGGPNSGTLWVRTITEPASGGPLTWKLSTGGMGTSGLWVVWVYTGNQPAYQRDCAVTTDDHLRAIGIGPWNDTGWHTYWWEYDTENNVTWHMTAWQDMRTVQSGFGGIYTHRTYGPHGNVMTEGAVENFYVAGVPTYFGTTTYSYYNASKYFQKESVTDSLGNTTSYDYFESTDANVGNRGEMKWVRDARYGVTGQQYEYTYNQYGQKSSETNLNDVVSEYTYGDTWGNLTQVVQDPGTGHLNRTTQTAYDVASRVTSSTDPKNQTSTASYNGVGQTVQATLPGETVSYTFGANGRTEGFTDGRGTTSIAYETGNDRIASTTDPVNGATSYTYLPTGERSTITLPGGGTWTYTYSDDWGVLPTEEADKAARLLLKVEDDQGRDVRYVLDATGRIHEAISNITYQNQSPISYVKTEYTYDGVFNPGYSQGLVARIRNTWNVPDPMTGQWQETVLVQNDYTYSDNGNRLTNTVSDDNGPIRTEEYAYDALNRLTGVDYGDGQTQTYTFDPMGNRLQKVDSVTGTENSTYDAANILHSRGSSSYTNDSNGNTLTGGGRTNTWDGQNRLTQCVTNTDTSSFVYGSDGLRRQATVNSVTTDLVLDGQSVVRERQGSSNVATYLYGPRGPEYRRNDASGAVRWYLYDGAGGVLGEIDASGNVTATRRLDVYGGVRASTGTSSSSHKFAGALGHSSDDATGLIYMRARYYDPAAGRFVSEDPGKDGRNWYAYAAGNPVRYRDADGKKITEEEYQYWDQFCSGVIRWGFGLALVGAALLLQSIPVMHSGLVFAATGMAVAFTAALSLLQQGLALACLGAAGMTMGVYMIVGGAVARSVLAYEYYLAPD